MGGSHEQRRLGLHAGEPSRGRVLRGAGLLEGTMNYETATEQELRDAELPKIESIEQLGSFINTLAERGHDYGTCVYAMSLAATAAFYYISGKLGVTGFQASCADMDILKRTRGWKWGRILDYENLLYPQYCDEEHFPSWRTILAENKEEFAKRAHAMLAEDRGVEEVRAHWRMLTGAQP